MADILAIIPFYKRQDQLDRCLSALAASTHPIEPFVHDNNVDNVGFTKACNIGLKESLRRGHKYALLLNQDCYVNPDAVGKAIAFMDAHPRCAIAGPKQLRAEEPDVIIHGGCTDAFPTGRHIVGRVSQGNCTVSLPMPWVNGAAMVVRMEAVVEFGLMDEGYFLIASDSDYCFTARLRGWEVWYCAESVVMHEGGGVSSKQASIEAVAHFNADQLHFRDKWLGSMHWELLRQVPPAKQHTWQEMAQAVQQAGQHYQKNEAQPAEVLARRILQHSPDHPDALLLLGHMYMRTGLPGLAARMLRQCVKVAPDSANAHAAAADALLMCSAAAEALERYDRAIQLGLATPELRCNRGVALLQLGRKEEAIADWLELLKAHPNNQALRKNLTDNGVNLPPAAPAPGVPLTPPSQGNPQGVFRLGGGSR
jgi:GT2 family glycosyltransferase